MKNTQSGHNNNSNNNSHCVLYGVAGCTGELNPPQLGEDITPVGEMLFARRTVNLWQSLLESPRPRMLDPSVVSGYDKAAECWELRAAQRVTSPRVKISAVSGNSQNNKNLPLVCEKSQVVFWYVLL